MLRIWAERFREIALCAWWFDLMVGTVGLGVVIIAGFIGGLFGAKPPKTKAA